jgi:2-polyprenyl-3-methyl-5-hydroxy-6-metoxy-1,4-benzoquinol methylase
MSSWPERVLARYALPGIRAAHLGSGPGAMAERLHSFGCDVVAVDRTAEGFEAGQPHVSLDFDQNDFASELSPASFDLVTAIEVIEHVESPIGFSATSGVCSLLGDLR